MEFRSTNPRSGTSARRAACRIRGRRSSGFRTPPAQTTCSLASRSCSVEPADRCRAGSKSQSQVSHGSGDPQGLPTVVGDSLDGWCGAENGRATSSGIDGDLRSAARWIGFLAEGWERGEVPLGGGGVRQLLPPERPSLISLRPMVVMAEQRKVARKFPIGSLWACSPAARREPGRFDVPTSSTLRVSSPVADDKACPMPLDPIATSRRSSQARGPFCGAA